MEYAKFVKCLSNSLGRGFQTVITLPSDKTFPQGYINFYLGMAGIEAGISTSADSRYFDSATGKYKWSWFVNGTEQAHPTNLKMYSDGATVSLKLHINDSTGKMEFIVDGVVVWTSASTYSDQSNCRLIIATGTGINYTTPVPATTPIAPWPIFHNQVVTDGMMYKNTSKVWVAITASNSTLTIWRDPGAAQGVDDAKNPDPDLYGVLDNRANNRLYASIKV